MRSDLISYVGDTTLNTCESEVIMNGQGCFLYCGADKTIFNIEESEINKINVICMGNWKFRVNSESYFLVREQSELLQCVETQGIFCSFSILGDTTLKTISLFEGLIEGEDAIFMCENRSDILGVYAYCDSDSQFFSPTKNVLVDTNYAKLYCEGM